MKSLLATAFLFFSVTLFAQTQYESAVDPQDSKSRILKGIINKNLIKSDTTYTWYTENQKSYSNPDAAIIKALNSDSTIKYVVFGGTWCDDTRFILPKFFMLQEKAGIAENRISIFGVDRNKETIGNLASALNITNVPTIIVMKDGKELGRVVEYGKTGKWDKELADIVAGQPK